MQGIATNLCTWFHSESIHSCRNKAKKARDMASYLPKLTAKKQHNRGGLEGKGCSGLIWYLIGFIAAATLRHAPLSFLSLLGAKRHVLLVSPPWIGRAAEGRIDKQWLLRVATRPTVWCGLARAEAVSHTGGRFVRQTEKMEDARLVGNKNGSGRGRGTGWPIT